jgi:hypothetical protein
MWWAACSCCNFRRATRATCCNRRAMPIAAAAILPLTLSGLSAMATATPATGTPMPIPTIAPFFHELTRTATVSISPAAIARVDRLTSSTTSSSATRRSRLSSFCPRVSTTATTCDRNGVSEPRPAAKPESLPRPERGLPQEQSFQRRSTRARRQQRTASSSSITLLKLGQTVFSSTTHGFGETTNLHEARRDDRPVRSYSRVLRPGRRRLNGYDEGSCALIAANFASARSISADSSLNTARC